MQITLCLATCVLPATALAHKPVTARYNYEEHIRPIFERHCSACHRPDGPTPMSLLTYDDARPWAEAIKEEVLLERMPPWPVRAGASFRDARVLSAGEIDRIADWVSGGTPRGKAVAVGGRSAEVTRSTSTPAAAREGSPSVSLTVRHAMSTERKEELVMTVFGGDDVGTQSARWLRAIDFAPGDRRVVRSARVDLIAANESPDSAPGELLFVWIPAGAGVEYPDDAARLVSAGARVRVRVRYRRPWNLANAESTVESELRLAFADRAPRREVVARRLEIESDSPGPFRIPEKTAHLLAITPLVTGATESAPSRRVEITLREGDTSALLFETRSLDPAWPQRLRLVEPLAIDDGVRIEARSNGRVALWIEYLSPRGESGE